MKYTRGIADRGQTRQHNNTCVAATGRSNRFLMKIQRKWRRSNVRVSLATGNRNNLRDRRFLKEIGCFGRDKGSKIQNALVTKNVCSKTVLEQIPDPVTGPIRKFAKQGSQYCVFARLNNGLIPTRRNRKYPVVRRNSVWRRRGIVIDQY